MKKILIAAIALCLSSAFAFGQTALTNYQPGPRLINGSQLNKMVAAVNNLQGTGTPGAVTGTTGVFSNTLTARSTTATPAAAAAVPAFSFGSAALGIYWGTGVPTISAAKGSIYIQTDGSTTATRLYINNGTTNWVAITTAS